MNPQPVKNPLPRNDAPVTTDEGKKNDKNRHPHERSVSRPTIKERERP